MPAKKKPLVVPQTSLMHVSDALAVIGAAVDVTVTALEHLEESPAATVLHKCVSLPLIAQRKQVDMVRHCLVKPRKKRKAKGRRK